jgi:hypothetical protein
MTDLSLKLDRRFEKQARGVFEKYEFTCGVLVDRPHKNPVGKKRGLKNFAGGPSRRIGFRSTKSIAEVSEDLRKHTGINFYTHPFRSRKNKDILKFIKSFFDLCAGRTNVRQTENLLQAVVRNPILRGDYGHNTEATAKQKGFDRFMIDTAQLFQAIRAKVTVKNVS